MAQPNRTLTAAARELQHMSTRASLRRVISDVPCDIEREHPLLVYMLPAPVSRGSPRAMANQPVPVLGAGPRDGVAVEPSSLSRRTPKGIRDQLFGLQRSNIAWTALWEPTPAAEPGLAGPFTISRLRWNLLSQYQLMYWSRRRRENDWLHCPPGRRFERRSPGSVDGDILACLYPWTSKVLLSTIH